MSWTSTIIDGWTDSPASSWGPLSGGTVSIAVPSLEICIAPNGLSIIPVCVPLGTISIAEGSGLNTSGIDANTVLLIESDTFDGDTVFVDLGQTAGCPHAVDIDGDITHSTDRAKFGESSIKSVYSSMANPYLQWEVLPEEFSLNNDFTVDMWLYLPTGGIPPVNIFEAYDDDYSTWFLVQLVYNSSLQKYYLSMLVKYYSGQMTGWEIYLNEAVKDAWNHLELTRDGTRLYTFCNGGLTDETVRTFNLTFASHQFISTGYFYGTPAEGSTLYFDEFRVSNAARHTEDFVPAEVSYSSFPPYHRAFAASAPESARIDASCPIPLARITWALAVPCCDIATAFFVPWHSWRVDPSIAQTIYLFTLTGAPDGLEDVIIPASSIQGRLRDGEPTYLSVVIPSDAWASDISARPNGELVVERGYRFSDGSTQLREIARVDLEDIRMDSGARNKSVTLSGHATISNDDPKTVVLSGVSYRSESNGKRRYRCTVDLFLRPGDTAIADDEEIIVDSISYTIGTSQEQMEISEA